MDPDVNSVPLEAMVADSESFQAQFLDLLPVAACVCDAKGMITRYNGLAGNLWGRKPQSGDGNEHFCGAFRYYYPDGKHLPHSATPMAACLADGLARKDLDLIMEKPDHSKVMVRVNITPLKNKAGIVTCYQEIPWQQEQQYGQLIQDLPAAIYTTDEKGRIMLYNKAAVELWGREPERGKDLWCGSWKIFQPDGTELPLDNCPMAITLKEQLPVEGVEIIVVRPDGSKRHVIPHPRPLLHDDGTVAGAINMLVDITAIRDSEQALRESEHKYRSLANTLEIKAVERMIDLKQSEERYHKMIEEVEDYAILLMDTAGIIQNWNKGAERIKGYKEEEIVGKSFQLFYLPEDRKNGLPLKLIAEAKQNGKAVQEGWRVRNDGTRFWGSIVITALHDGENNVIGFSKVTRDLTERKLAEDKINQYAKELEFQNKELEQFAYVAAHDMKEPLRKIRFFNDYILENTGTQLTDKVKDYLSRSIFAATRMKSLIDDLLAYSKASSFSQQLEMTDLNVIMQQAIAANKESIENSSATIAVGELPVLQGIPFQFSQLFDNFINNSLKYAHPDRPPQIKISSERVPASTLTLPEGYLSDYFYKISIRDNGIGFDPSFTAKIFDLFQRLHVQTDYTGSGVGLAICKKIVQNHGGYIQATGYLNEGAEFDVFLPCER